MSVDNLSRDELHEAPVGTKVRDEQDDLWTKIAVDDWLFVATQPWQVDSITLSTKELMNLYDPLALESIGDATPLRLTETQARELADTSSLLSVVRLLEGWGIEVVAGE